MLTLISLIVTIVLQFIAAFTALRLIKKTKYSISWILISIGLLIMAIQRAFEFIPHVFRNWEKDVSTINTWLGIVSSLVLAIGVFLIRKIFNYLKKIEKNRIESEKHILQAVVQTEERERRRFAKDLHDGLGPLLSTVKMSVSTLYKLEEDKKKIDIIENADLVINEAIRSLKEISNNLSPHILDNFGLASAINSFVSKINTTKSINIDFKSDIYDKRFDYNIEVVLYRVLCELINNTVKHAGAKNIDIELSLHENILSLSYTDDGIGFDVNAVLSKQNSGMGYSNIINRIRSIKGMINIESDENKGTKAIIIVNINNSVR
jgi:signal transduction histidine kinase